MNTQERREILSMISTMTTSLEDLRTRVLRSCESCDHWQGTCVKWNSDPPPEVMEVGCEAFETEIPF